MRRVLIADDHPISSAVLNEAALAVGGEVSVTSVETLSDVMSHLRAGGFDALVLDLELANRPSQSRMSRLRVAYPDLLVLIVSRDDARSELRTLAAMGMQGFVRKTAPVAQLRSAITVVLEGGTYFPAIDRALRSRIGALAKLSPAQTRVSVELARGSSNKIIAHELGLSEATVKTHLSAIFRTLEVTNRSQAILALQPSLADVA